MPPAMPEILAIGSWPPGRDTSAKRIGHTRRRWRTNFGLDSPVEGTGFEPSVPRERLVPSFSFTPTFPLVRVNRPDPIPKGLHHAGTDGSNPASGESRELRYTGGAPEPRTLPRLCRIRWR